MEKWLIENGWICRNPEDIWPNDFQKGRYRVWMDTSAQADLLVQKQSGEWINIHGIFTLNTDAKNDGLEGVSMKDEPLALIPVLKLYGLYNES